MLLVFILAKIILKMLNFLVQQTKTTYHVYSRLVCTCEIVVCPRDLTV